MSGASTVPPIDLDGPLSRGRFSRRHLGSHHREIAAMLETAGYASLGDLLEKTVPANIRLNRPLSLPRAVTEE